jgi:hypothetical protein
MLILAKSRMPPPICYVPVRDGIVIAIVVANDNKSSDLARHNFSWNEQRVCIFT